MKLVHALDEMLIAKDYTAASVRVRREVLGDFIRWANGEGLTDLSQLKRSDVRRYIAYLRVRPNKKNGGQWASETQHTNAAYVRAFLRWCVSEGWLNADVVVNFEMPRVEKKVVDVLSYQHFELLHRAADSNYIPALCYRDKALLSLMIDTGVRAMEVCSVHIDDVFTNAQESYIRVHGKGRRQREVGIGKQTKLALFRYLTHAHGAISPVSGSRHLSRSTTKILSVAASIARPMPSQPPCR